MISVFQQTRFGAVRPICSYCFLGRNLTCIRGERMVFTRLSFTLGPGESLLIIGPNGSGKSSLLRLLAGLSRPAAGDVYWKGRPENEDYTAAVRYVGHLDAIKPALSVAEALGFWGRLAGLGQQQVAESTAQAMTCFGLSAFADTPGRLLSAGQKRRVNLARLLLGTADLWLLDEPATALDQESITALGRIIAAHRARGGIVILSTHMIVDLPQAQRLDMRDFACDPLTIHERTRDREGSHVYRSS